MERRFINSDTPLTVTKPTKGKRKLEGTAVRYDSMSKNLGGFREVISRGAFSESIGRGDTVMALVDHDSSKVLGNTRSETLSLQDTPTGVEFEISMPDTGAARDTMESVNRGDLSQMSFGFRVMDDTWDIQDGESVRTVLRADLFDVSVVAFPAYENTDVQIALRSLTEWQKENTSMKSDTVERPETKVAPPETQVDKSAETTVAPAPERRSAPPEIKPDISSSYPPEQWRNRATGAEVRVLRPGDKFTDLHRSSEPLSLGRAVRAMVVGSWDDAPAEHRALSTTSNPSAGILAPDSLSASVIDKARAISVLMRAGAKTVAMDSSTLKIARISTDATVEAHSENTAFTGSDVVFDGVELVAHTLGVLVKISRELASDAPNAVALIESAIAARLAERIDFYGLQGTGSAQPLGLLNFASTNSFAVGGAVDWDDVLNGVKEIEIDNHAAGAYIMSPLNASNLRQLKVNSEVNHYASPPALIGQLNGLVTSNMPDATMVVGDFSQFIVGLRQSPVIEVTTEGGSSFEEHSVFVKVTWRGSFNTEHRDAFTLLTGIS